MATVQEEFDLAVEAASSAWLCNSTIINPQWRLRQLHGLVDLLSESREELLAILARQHSKPTNLYEHEFAILMQYLARLIAMVQEATSRGQSHLQSGRVSTMMIPRGTSLIISNTDNPIRFGLVPFAASVAAGNTVVLAHSIGDKALHLLQSNMARHLDNDTLHIVSLKKSHPKWDVFGHILICDKDTETWASCPTSPNVVLLNVSEGRNAAVIDEGLLKIDEAVKHIRHVARSNERIYDALDVVFIDKVHMWGVVEAIDTLTSVSKQEWQQTQNFPFKLTQISRLVVTLGLPFEASQLEQAMEFAVTRNALLLVESNSIHHSIDLCRRVPHLRQLALLNPVSKKQASYLASGTRSHIFSVGGFAIDAPEDNSTVYSWKHTPTTTIFSPATFSQPRVVSWQEKKKVLESVEVIRRLYEGKIPPMAPEHPGGRIDFFVQVAYALAAGASVVGALGLVGVWFGVKAVRGRYLS